MATLSILKWCARTHRVNAFMGLHGWEFVPIRDNNVSANEIGRKIREKKIIRR